MKRKKKVNMFNVQINNITNFNNFANIMLNMKIKLKLIDKKYLKEVFCL